MAAAAGSADCSKPAVPLVPASPACGAAGCGAAWAAGGGAAGCGAAWAAGGGAAGATPAAAAAAASSEASAGCAAVWGGGAAGWATTSPASPPAAAPSTPPTAWLLVPPASKACCAASGCCGLAALGAGAACAPPFKPAGRRVGGSCLEAQLEAHNLRCTCWYAGAEQQPQALACHLPARTCVRRRRRARPHLAPAALDRRSPLHAWWSQSVEQGWGRAAGGVVNCRRDRGAWCPRFFASTPWERPAACASAAGRPCTAPRSQGRALQRWSRACGGARDPDPVIQARPSLVPAAQPCACKHRWLLRAMQVSPGAICTADHTCNQLLGIQHGN